jgi:hypothetical protein
MKCRLSNIWPVSVTLTLGVATQFLRFAHHLIIVITCAQLHVFQKMFSGLKVMELRRKCYGRTSGQNRIRGHFFSYFLLLNRGPMAPYSMEWTLLFSFVLFTVIWPPYPYLVVWTEGQTEAIPIIPFPQKLRRGLKSITTCIGENLNYYEPIGFNKSDIVGNASVCEMWAISIYNFYNKIICLFVSFYAFSQQYFSHIGR